MNIVESRLLVKNGMYNAFPSITRAADGRLVLVYRQAQNSLKKYGKISHVDGTSCVAMITSVDDGQSWSKARIIYNDEMGEQDPYINTLSDGTLLCTFFRWKIVPLDRSHELGDAYRHYGRVVYDRFAAVHIGTVCIASTDNGETWDGPRSIDTPAYEGPAALSGNCLEIPPVDGAAGIHDDGKGNVAGTAGTILAPMFAVRKLGGFSECFVMGSRDNGRSWEEAGIIPTLPGLHFLEPFLYRAPSGRIDILMRTQKDFFTLPFDETYLPLHVSSSMDNGITWSIPRETGLFCPNPIRIAPAGSGQILAAYGQRREPRGIEGFITAAEQPIFSDSTSRMLKASDSGDLGYTSCVRLRDGKMMIVYYITDSDNEACIGATWLEV